MSGIITLTNSNVCKVMIFHHFFVSKVSLIHSDFYHNILF
jgi:hypothetical protein